MAVFISYSQDSPEHIDWVKGLAERLLRDHIDVRLDQWDLDPGQHLTQFMEESIRDTDFVLIICTPAYKQKFDKRDHGVGYEGNIITAEILYKQNHLKFLPILRSGEWLDAAPTSQSGKYYINLRPDNRNYEAEYIKLRNTLRGAPPRPLVEPEKDWDTIKLHKVSEFLLGRALSGPYGIRYTDGYLFTEGSIKLLLNDLMRYTARGGWITVLNRRDIDQIINDHVWKNGAVIYSYSENERKEIMDQCARAIKYRLEQYAGEGRILHIVHSNGDIGFRYK